MPEVRAGSKKSHYAMLRDLRFFRQEMPSLSLYAGESKGIGDEVIIVF